MSTDRDFLIEGADPTAPSSVAVYHLYNDARALLYVGITNDPKKRFAQHAKDKRWWWEVCTWEIYWCDTRDEAERYESRVIREQYPAYNIAGAQKTPPEMALIRKWGGERRPKRAAIFDLDVTYVYWRQAESLRADACRMWTDGTLGEIYYYMLSVASKKDVRKHLDYARSWDQERLTRVIARDRRRRETDVAIDEAEETAAREALIAARLEVKAAASKPPRPRGPLPPIDEQFLAPRDLLADVIDVLEGQPHLRATDVVSGLRIMTCFSHPPYLKMSGLSLMAQLRELGVHAAMVNGTNTVRRDCVVEAMQSRPRKRVHTDVA